MINSQVTTFVFLTSDHLKVWTSANISLTSKYFFLYSIFSFLILLEKQGEVVLKVKELT